MTLEQVRNLKWEEVNWAEFMSMHLFQDIKAVDIDNYVEFLFQNKSRELGIPYKECKDFLISENVAFFNYKKRLFETYYFLKPLSTEWVGLQKLFKLPTVPTVPCDVEKILADCAKLTNSEKLMVLKSLSQMIESN